MHKGRLEAFSDGVIAIIITIMVLELHTPHEASFAALHEIHAILLSYVLSYLYVGIYWNNHHHLLQAAERVAGSVLWANLHLLFWLSLIPFVTRWMGETHFAPVPVAVYGFVLLLAGIAYAILTRTLITHHGQGSTLAAAVGQDRKGWLSVALYALAIPIAFAAPRISCGIYALVALLWLLPDTRIERLLSRQHARPHPPPSP
jgi:uncharacterized membrane protein